ncbi:MAG: YdeI/OmpD-associated family protein [Candidatus Micrarchaeota archaeon]
MKDREQWRSWLEKNHSSKKEIWLIYFKKHTKKKSVSYNEAVEEAICFGWIDGKVRTIDDERFMRRYSPRRARSIWAQSNIRRANKMINEGRMTEYGLELFRKKKKESVVKKRYIVPKDLGEALSENKLAKAIFAKLAPSHRKHYVWWIESAKKEETRKRRIKRVVKWVSENKKPGMM